MYIEIEVDNRGNKIIGEYPMVTDSSINFIGNNNILVCDGQVRLTDTTLNFNGNNSIIYLGEGSDYKLEIDIYNNSALHIGRFCGFTKKLKIILSEHKHCFIGDSCLFSLDVILRNSDPHLIYDCNSKRRINVSKSIYIGDHVWIGQFVNILKGTEIDSGSIIGASSVVAGKKISHNSIWAGNPCRKIKDNVFWDKTCVHGFTEEMTENSMNYSNFISKNRDECHDDWWFFDYNEEEAIEWSEVEVALSNEESYKKYQYLNSLSKNRAKNRFVHNI